MIDMVVLTAGRMIAEEGVMEKEKVALRTAGILFAVVAGAHLARILAKLPVLVGRLHVPLWVSAVAAVVAFALAVWMFYAAGDMDKK